MSTDKREKHSLDKEDTGLEIASIVTSSIPLSILSGPISSILGGIANERKFNRIKEFLIGLDDDFRKFKTDVDENYIQSEEFEELFEKTLDRVAAEYKEEKRKLYRNFLIQSVKSPKEDYDEKIKFLRLLDELQLAHISVIKAIKQEPERATPGLSSTILQILRKRLPNMPDEKIITLLGELKEMKITQLTDPNVMITEHAAVDLRSGISTFGQRFLKYIIEAS